MPDIGVDIGPDIGPDINGQVLASGTGGGTTTILSVPAQNLTTALAPYLDANGLLHLSQIQRDAIHVAMLTLTETGRPLDPTDQTTLCLLLILSLRAPLFLSLFLGH